jgi:triacylglycerol lipase
MTPAPGNQVPAEPCGIALGRHRRSHGAIPPSLAVPRGRPTDVLRPPWRYHCRSLHWNSGVELSYQWREGKRNVGTPDRITATFLLAAAVAGTVALAGGCAGTVRSEEARDEPEGRASSSVRPLILVHGAFGFGRDELFGYHYWGGPVDIQERLRRRGYPTFTAEVGPVSSNWDRACELYACIKGGRVDYGAVHARRHGHARFGRTYPGLFPAWGTTDALTGRIRTVHLVGHSLGGQTARVLVQLLAEGCPEERDAPALGLGADRGEAVPGAAPQGAPAGALPGASSGSAGLSPLFAGGHDWVASVTSISTPHDGTTATVRFGLDGSPMEVAMTLFLTLSGTSASSVYDFRLDQWGLQRQPGESARTYRTLVAASPVWHNLEDTSLEDGSPEGARELNRWVHAQPGVYYFSWATEETYRDPLSGTRVPGWGMNPSLAVLSSFLGSYTCTEPGRVPVDESWWPNDGLVNTCSMDGPTLGSSDTIVPYPGREAGPPRPGVWNFMGVLRSVDHLDIVGLDPLWREHPRGSASLVDWYASLARMLADLPE